MPFKSHSCVKTLREELTKNEKKLKHLEEVIDGQKKAFTEQIDSLTLKIQNMERKLDEQYKKFETEKQQIAKAKELIFEHEKEIQKQRDTIDKISSLQANLGGLNDYEGLKYKGPYAQCNNCDSFLVRKRYKCVLCSDYDLCQSCLDKNVHEHNFILLY